MVRGHMEKQEFREVALLLAMHKSGDTCVDAIERAIKLAVEVTRHGYEQYAHSLLAPRPDDAEIEAEMIRRMEEG
jgi:hypothetical protein